MSSIYLMNLFSITKGSSPIQVIVSVVIQFRKFDSYWSPCILKPPSNPGSITSVFEEISEDNENQVNFEVINFEGFTPGLHCIRFLMRFEYL